jgi:hypothetical protein
MLITSTFLQGLVGILLGGFIGGIGYLLSLFTVGLEPEDIELLQSILSMVQR